MLTDQLFIELVKAASQAPSADNMQPWEFCKKDNTIEVFCAKNRMLPTDVNGMFTWVSIGAAIQNIVVMASSKDLESTVEYFTPDSNDKPAAVVRFSKGKADRRLAKFISLRTTNRSIYETLPLEQSVISQ